MQQLFEQPFTTINTQGVIGVFPDPEQVLRLKSIVDSFAVQTGQAAP